MRLWSLHPRYLDAKGLVALWREALLAQSVLCEKTKGYKNHPQLDRFKEARDPVLAIGAYLQIVFEESCRRGYCFNPGKIVVKGAPAPISVTDGQVHYEWDHLLAKLARRDPDRLAVLREVTRPEIHPLFVRRKGGVEAWER